MKRLHAFVAVSLVTGLVACTAKEIPDSPAAVEVPTRVTITVEYRQPNSCSNIVTECAGDVVFYGSWMRPGVNVVLRAQPGSFIWTATISSVPVNFPPDDEPYFVRVYDPFLRDTASQGVSGRRIELGGQSLNVLDRARLDTPEELAWVYVDANGVGRNPF